MDRAAEIESVLQQIGELFDQQNPTGALQVWQDRGKQLFLDSATPQPATP